MIQKLHIVCLDAPSPPNYGGAIDMFYKIKALAAFGVQITLHYFNYNSSRGTQGLEDSCEAIYAYHRKSFLQSLPIFKPHIISSRRNNNLIERLNSDDAPILLEGLHCTGIIPWLENSRRVVVRMHNEEAAYYRFLAKAETSPLKMMYFKRESHLLKQYQMRMEKTVTLACLSQVDVDVLKSNYQFSNSHFVPCFIPWQNTRSLAGRGDYCLYHGNLSVSENAEAAFWLISNVFNEITIPFVIAGKSIPPKIIKQCEQLPHVRLVNNPSIVEIDELVRNAHINVLPSLNVTGVKLKLLNALINGRFCITNTNGVIGSELENFMAISNDATSLKEKIHQLMSMNFTKEMIDERKAILSLYNNQANAKRLSDLW